VASELAHGASWRLHQDVDSVPLAMQLLCEILHRTIVRESVG
jgi:hypothetical protein